MLIPVRSWMMMFFLLTLGGVGYYIRYDELPFPVSDDDLLRTELAERWAQKVAAEIRRLPGRPRVAVARVINDQNGILTGQLRKWIARRNVLVENNNWYSGLEYSSGLTTEPTSPDDAVREVQSELSDYVVVAVIHEWTTYPEFEVCLRGQVDIRDVRSGTTVFTCELALPEVVTVTDTRSGKDRTVSLSQPREPAQITSKTMPQKSPSIVHAGVSHGYQVTRFGIWMAIVAVSPFVLARPLQRQLALRRNSTNAFLLTLWIAGISGLAAVTWLPYMSLPEAVLPTIIAVGGAVLYFGYCCQSLRLQ